MSEEEPAPNHTVLKSIVALLGVAIVAMTVLIIYTAIDRMGDGGEEAVAEVPRTTAQSKPLDLTGLVRIFDPVGGRILSAEIDGGVMMVLVERKDSTRHIALFDLASGEKVGVLEEE